MSFLSFFFLSFFGSSSSASSGSSPAPPVLATLTDLVSEEETLLLELFDDFVHGVLVLSWFSSTGEELESLFHLVLESFTKLGSWVLGEAIDSGGDSTLVGKISGDSTLVLLVGTAFEWPIKVELKIRPYFGVLPLVFKALKRAFSAPRI